MNDRLRSMLVWDNHACMPLEADCAHMGELGRCRGAGIDVVSLNISSGDLPSAQALPVLAAFRAWVNDHPEHYVLIGSAAEARQAKASGRLGVCFDIEGMTGLEFEHECTKRDLLGGATDEHRVRFVTHEGITSQDIQAALKICSEILN